MHAKSDILGTCSYVNVPGYIGLIITERFATLHELDNDYGAEDAYNLLEVIMVNNHNKIVYANSHR